MNRHYIDKCQWEKCVNKNCILLGLHLFIMKEELPRPLVTYELWKAEWFAK